MMTRDDIIKHLEEKSDEKLFIVYADKMEVISVKDYYRLIASRNFKLGYDTYSLEYNDGTIKHLGENVFDKLEDAYKLFDIRNDV